MPRSKPEWKVLSVTFEITAQNRGQFSVPEAIAKLLGAKSKDSLNLSITRLSGESVFDGPKILVSGKEIMGSEIKEGVKPRERIRVQASRLASK
jgi:hypothetical protein